MPTAHFLPLGPQRWTLGGSRSEMPLPSLRPVPFRLHLQLQPFPVTWRNQIITFYDTLRQRQSPNYMDIHQTTCLQSHQSRTVCKRHSELSLQKKPALFAFSQLHEAVHAHLSVSCHNLYHSNHSLGRFITQCVWPQDAPTEHSLPTGN